MSCETELKGAANFGLPNWTFAYCSELASERDISRKFTAKRGTRFQAWF
jgi:hypothetical protein